MSDTVAPKETILIVDDDMFLLDMYANRFKQAGFDVDTAMSGEQALEKIEKGASPSVLLLDVVMPTLDGFELLEHINAQKLVPSALKIFLSNLGQEEDISRGKKLGAAGYIIKANSTPSEVVDEVRSIITQHHGV